MAQSKNKTPFSYVEKFLNCDGISGFEHEISKVYIDEAKKYGAKISRDGFGSVIATVGNKGPSLMLVSHMDEIGFVVQRIEKNGFLRVSPVGGHWVHTILAMQVKIITRKGKEYPGVIGSVNVHVLPPEQRTKVMKMEQVFVDVGLDSKEAVEKAGIKVGDQVVRISEAKLLADGDKFMAKAIDNRVSVAIIAKVLENLANKDLKSQVHAVASAQEEVGSRGSKASTQKLSPDLTIAIDTTSSHDIPNIIPGNAKLGLGVTLTVKDVGAIANPLLVDFLEELAQKHKIPCYRDVTQGGITDAETAQYSQGGIPVVTISIPTRYMHTPFEVGSLKDFDAVVELLTEFCLAFDQKTLESFLY